MASAADRDAELARLSGPDLVAHLRATCRSADYDAAARVLAARDRRLAEAEAAANRVQGGVASALAEVAALRDKYEALRGAARHGPGSEAARPVGAIAAPAPAPPGERRAVGAEGAEAKGGDFIDLWSSDDDEADEECRTGLSGMPFKRKLLPSGDDEERLRAGAEVPRAPCNREPSAYPTSDDDNDDAIPLSQLIKKRRGAGPGAREPKTGMGAAQACSAGPLGIDVQKNYPVIREGGEVAAELRIGGSEEPKVGTFVQGNGNGKSKEDGAMRPWRTGSTVRSSSPKNSAKVDEDKTNGGARVTKMLAETNGIEVQSGMILRAREQKKINGRVNKEKVLPEANGIREQGGKLSSVQATEVKGTVQLGTSDKPVSDNSVQLRASDKPVSACTFQLGTSDKLVSASLYSSPMFVDGIPKDQAVMINAHTPAAPLLDPITVEGSNQRELQKKPANSESHSWLKSSLADGEHARIAGRGSTAAALCTLSCLKHVSVSSKVNKNLENGNSEMRSVPHGSSSTVATNVLTLKKCSSGVDDVRARSETRGGPKHTLCKLTTTESSFESGSSFTPSRALIFSPSSSKSNSIQGKGETSTLPSKVTRDWKSENDTFTSCLTNKEILLQAICALYRQRKFVTAPRGGGRTGNNGLQEHETHRVAKLAEFLLDGNLQGPLKRNVEQLLECDPTGLCFLEDVVLRCVPQLFDIYKNKEDPYFC